MNLKDSQNKPYFANLSMQLFVLVNTHGSQISPTSQVITFLAVKLKRLVIIFHSFIRRYDYCLKNTLYSFSITINILIELSWKQSSIINILIFTQINPGTEQLYQVADARQTNKINQ